MRDSSPQVRGCKLEQVNQEMVETVAHLIQVVDKNVSETFYLFRNVLFSKLLLETCVQVREVFLSANLFRILQNTKEFSHFQ